MVTRRNFLKRATLASAGLAVGGLGTMNAESYNRIVGANRKVNIAYIGIGNRGEQIISDFEKTGLVNVVALCDIDMGAKHTQKVMAKYPKAKQFKDFRVMFDKIGNEFEAVTVATPDFSHFPICMMAMAHGKHVYVEKPMARTFLEAELMMKAARKYPNVVTQVGNQGHSEANYFQFKAWQDAGIIKDVTSIVAHMNNPRRWHGWDVNIYKYPEAQPIPSTLDWMTWHCAAPYHEYNEKYHYGEWRSWYDFGMGALGDWGAHILDTVHEFLDLGLPYEIDPVNLVGHNDYFFPTSSTIKFKFGPRGEMPACDVTWYDGIDNLPPIPAGYGESALDPNIPASGAGEIKKQSLNPGKIIYSKELTFKGASHGSTLSIIPESKAKDMASKLPEVPKSPSNHFQNFLLACTGVEKTRSPFEIHGPLSQVFSLGVMAQRLNTKFYFDSRTKQITNNAFANAMLTGIPPRKGWEDFYRV
ncbi:Gfo/Idh/MocA family oxidoreductase [Dysgonomonas sp. Marseille-P4677]|uniref:Gfo/Idh/MocA family oxidoreductase n=1 Tax=Dysgonomonas sp. Marseille-P4677 TaxID=2364790 RepID=UPI00191275D5|nr:Gfo/Idh/MocA family oxidoreductase [Dysgonomonas sp. Marseille-P4677]MBK5720665.1 Gfo/Idh/MocA family oxidoreductase [Dysgonomonas sp. Marseille-P4677]